MRTNNLKVILKAALRVVCILPFAAAVALGQQTVSLTAGPSTATLPDGSLVPMWGYSCGAAVTGSTATCVPLNTTAVGGWSPVVITVPAGQSLTVNLTNNLSFLPAGRSTANTVPTSLVIVGQLGGGLGNLAQRTTTASPDHSALPSNSTSWPIAGGPGFTPPTQGPRVQSFSTEVAAGATTSLTWTNLRPGTYLIESGTHPSIQGPMGLYGILVVTCPPSATTCATPGTAYPVNGTNTGPVTYNAEVPLIFSEIDPVQNNAVNSAVTSPGFNEMTMRTLGDQIGSITITNGGSGYTSNPSVTFSGAAGSTSASASAAVGAVVTGITLSSGGTGYSSGTTVNITDTAGTGSGATAKPVLAFGVASITVTSGGAGYSVGDVINFNGGGGSGATATVATLGANGAIATVTVTNVGTGYSTAPAVSSITGPGVVSSIAVTSGGTGYAVNDLVNLTGGGGSGATAAVGAVGTGGVITSVTVTNGGTGYTTAPTVSSITSAGTGAVLAPAVKTGTVGAVLAAVLATTGTINAITVTNGGSFYTTPTATITDPAATPGTGATVSAVLKAGTYGVVYAVTLTNGGSGYHMTPVVTIAAPGGTTGTQATASAIVSQACAGGLGCYPSAVNYTPLYYMINGVAFNKTSASASLFPVTPNTVTAGTGTVLVRMVNAGLRMHVPSIVGSLTGATPVGGFSVIAEDGNPLPGLPRVQSEVFMAAGKTYDVMINAPAAPAAGTAATALPVYDRELSLSGNAIARDAGMLAYIGINGSGLPGTSGTGVFAAAVARNDTYSSVIAGQTLIVSDPAKGVMANDTNVYGVHLLTAPVGGTVTLNTNGTFTYVANAATSSDSFTYCANGSVTGTTCSSGLIATVTLGAATIEGAGGIIVGNKTYTSNTATALSIKPSGVLTTTWSSVCTPTATSPCHDYDAAGYPLTVAMSTGNAPVPAAGLTLTMDPNGDGGFTASVTAAGTYTFSYKAQNSQGTVSASSATVTLIFPAATGLAVKVLDGTDKSTVVGDYRWIIEEDRTFYVNPNCTTNSTTPIVGCAPLTGTGVPLTFGTNFHTSYMPVVAAGCTGPLSCESGQKMVDPATGVHVYAVCDVGNGVCRPDPDPLGKGFTTLDPSQVHLDPTKHYYISVLPGDAANPFNTGNAQGGHGMGGAPIIPTCVNSACTFNPVTVFAQPTPFPPSRLTVFVFEDDFPLNGEQDGGGGTGAVNTNNEPGLGQFNITLFDDAGGTGDATGQMTYDMFNQPLSNSLAGTKDPVSGLDACPISANSRIGTIPGPVPDPAHPGQFLPIPDPTQTGITGTIVTCPLFESDGLTPSPLAGQAVVANLMPGRYGVVATPGADRIARGEEWLQTNTLDGQKAHDSFLRIGEPSFFQEYGPAGFHVSIGFANPKIINSRKAAVCAGTDPTVTGSNCNNTVTGMVTTSRMSRTPDERLYSSGDNSSFAFTQCYVSFGDPDGEDFAFTKCNANGTFTLTGLPDGDWRVTVFDQWNDSLVDGLSTPVRLANGATTDLGQIATNQWQANIYTKTFFDQSGTGVSTDYTGTACTAPNTPAGCNPNYGNSQSGLTLVPTNIRFRDGSYSNFNNTDLAGNAGFNEVFPLFSWYVVESDSARYKNTGTHVVYDAGGPSDGSTCGGTTGTVCGNSNIAGNLANTAEQISVPTALRVPGARYCASADCPAGDNASGTTGLSTGRVDPPWVGTEGWQGFSGQNSFIEFGKKPFAVGENGGIRGEVIYASTRPFDDPALLIHTSWTPDVPGVTINLYKEGTAADNVTPTLTLVDTTKTSSWDDWAQGFNTTSGVPNMNCPGQGTATGTNGDLFYFTLFDQPEFLDVYNNQHNGTPLHTVPNDSQFKCYDGMHNWNQVQPAPYDGMYKFPSVTGINPTTGKPAGTNCTICVANPDATDLYWGGLPMLPAGKYVVEVVVPPGYELVKEEDKNILIGDNYIAPVTQQFGGLGAIFIVPDQAAVGASYNPNNAQNPTQDLGSLHLPRGEGDTGSVEIFWPCVGASRIVPDYISLFPQSGEVAPFAGATRNLCDRKEVTLQDQMSALAKFWVFSSTHVAAHFTGVITDDYTSEFDPFSPQFGEKFSPANLPISIKDWTGTEISRVYSDQWGTYDGLTYSTWEVNPPNPTGYAPTMMVSCMNDPGPIPGPNGKMIPDPLFNPQYSQFCYEIPFMPGQTQYMDTPVVPTSAFAGAGYNNVDCAYPDATPAVSEVDGDQIGPWVSAAGHTLTITSLGDQMVPNNAYTGPSATTAPYNAKTVKRHYGFGARGTGANAGTVTIGGIPATVGTWSDTTITVSVPNGVPDCPVQQQAQYGGPGDNNNNNNNNNNNINNAQCGELVIATGTVTTGTGGVTGVTVTNAGNGYTARPTVAFNNTGTGGSGAAASTFLGVTRVTVPATGIGRGYTSAPAVTFTASPAGAAATATGTAILGSGTTAGRVVGVTVTNPGSGYASRPTVTFAPPSCTINGTTCVQATLTNSSTTGVFMDVVSVTVTAAGTGYTSNPTVTFTSPSCTINATTCVRATGTAAASPIQTFQGRQSIDTVTVTIGGKAPTHVAPLDSIQVAIDAADPGDLIIVDPTCTTTAGAAAACTTPSATNVHSPTAHNELLIMWKPVRLQGVGAASSIINANTHPAGKLDAWRQRVVCLFGLSLNGTPTSAANPFDSTGAVTCGSTNGTAWNHFSPYGASGNFNPQIDRLPLEAVVGWDAELNGNLAEQLQEPSLMGALEGAGITVLAKGVNFLANSFDPSLLAGFPTGTKLLMGIQPESTGNFSVGDANANCHTSTTNTTNPFPSNYSCNPSSIDGLGITNSSQGGGGIFIHGWGHNLQIGNNRIYSNAGTLSGGINVGQGEYPPAYIQGAGALNAAPGSCEDSPVPNAVLPYCQNVNVNVHNNDIALNSSNGDELFSATPAGAGGVSFCTGSDYYKFNYNWVCGNLSSGDGGGVGHLGFSYNGDIEHNSILFNQSTNPTIQANGGGLIVMGTPDADIVCNGKALIDQDCVPYNPATGTGNPLTTPISAVGPSDGVGPGLVINANLIMGNSAESGSGGGIAFQAVNGSDMVAFPANPRQWNTVTVTNNIIADNVAGWDGGGISLIDSTGVNIINNTIAFNSSTASAGPLFNTLGAPLGSTPPGTGQTCTANCGTTTNPQPAGVVAIQNSAILRANLPSTVPVTCPTGHPSCRSVSTPKLENNIIWHNSSYYIGVGPLGAGTLNQQHVVALYNASIGAGSASNPIASQTTTGQCVAASYWDIGVRGDTGPTNHNSGVTLAASASVLTAGGSAVTGSGNSGGNPNLIRPYCDGSRTPPEAVTAGVVPAAAIGWQVPPGISDATVPNPIFNLTPSATVDEGNNWVNLNWGPLSMTNPAVVGGPNGNFGGGLPLGNYGITAGSSAASRVTGANFTDAPAYDFFNTPRKPGNSTDAGAVRLTTAGGGSSEFTLSPSLVDFGLVPAHSPTTVDQDVQVINSGSAPLTFNGNGNAAINCAGVATGCSVASFTIRSNTCAGTTLGAGQSCVINVVFNPVSTSQAQRNATLAVTVGGITQTVALSGHDTIATISVSPITPALTTNPANATAKTGTITLTNTMNPNTNADAGPYIPTAITLTPLTATGTFTLGGSCAVGAPISPGGTLVPPAAGSSCTITITYTPPAGATGAALNGRVNLIVAGYGTASTAPIINTTYNAN